MLSAAKHPYPDPREFHVYIMSNTARTLYTGMTNDLLRRVNEHRAGTVAGFTSQYKLTRLVYFESTPYVLNAIEREKQIKGWRRSKKIALIESVNPRWEDLAEGLFGVADSSPVGSE